MRAKHRALISVCVGILVGLFGAIWLQSKGVLTWPCESVLIGLGAGVGGRVGRAFGTPNQVRIVVFASLAGFCCLHYVDVYLGRDGPWPLLDMTTAHIQEIVISFLVFLLGLILGIRTWLGGDIASTLDEYSRLDIE
ncbi:MAG: hypothetical protein CMH52_11795 [Myxococcales bacterium]|nr:hypothetical protein [Myxococcales bacterium]|tara:strand:+ start:724 stop:1134 length:411 start_codon:yes stop_codon:yes gene_type:complete